jgi:hypothetical protein
VDHHPRRHTHLFTNVCTNVFVMTGIAGGEHYSESGSGTSYLCLPHDPDSAPSNFPCALDSSSSYVARVWGAEFQYTYGKVKVDDDVPCAQYIYIYIYLIKHVGLKH